MRWRAQGRMVGVLEIDMQVIAEIRHDIKMDGMAGFRLRVMAMTMMVVLISINAVMPFLLYMKRL
jgi:hypothetical protein